MSEESKQPEASNPQAPSSDQPDAKPPASPPPGPETPPEPPPQEESASPPPPEPPTGAAAPTGDLAKADPVKRVLATVIDMLLASIVGFIPFIGGIAGALYILLRDALPVEALEYKSVGKKAMNLDVVSLTNPSERIDYATSARRNWMFAMGPVMLALMYIPILGWLLDIILAIGLFILGIMEIVKIFSDEKGHRLGDKMAQTQVIEK